MLTPPVDLTDETVASVVRSGWGVDVVETTYLPVGFGSHHWRVTDPAGARWFVTADDLRTRQRSADDSIDAAYARLHAALGTACAVREAGASFVVAPVRSRDGAVVVRCAERFAVAVYPHLEGRQRDFADVLDCADSDGVVTLLATLHGTQPDGCRPAAETFELSNRDRLTAALRGERRAGGGPYAEPVHRLLVRRGPKLEQALGSYDRRVADARAARRPLVVTHGEPHPGNLIETAAGWALVDWDTTLLAPPERDLWFVGSDPEWVAERYHALTGRAVDRSLLALYRLMWDLKDIAEYVALLTGPHDDSDDVRKTWRGLNGTIEALVP